MRSTSDNQLARIVNAATLGPLQIRVIAICFLIAMLDGFDTQSIAFVAPALKSSWGVAPDDFGIIFGAGLFGTMIGAVLLGAVADRIGRKVTIVISMLTFGAMSLLCATATTVDQLLLYRLLTGIGLGGAIPNIIALTSEYAPEKIRTTAVTVMFAGFPLGAVLGGMGSAQILGIYGWQAVFIAGGLLPLLVLPVVLIGLPESIQFLAVRRQDKVKVTRIMRRVDPAFDVTQIQLSEQTTSGPRQATVKALFTEGRAVWTLLLWTVISMSLLLTYFLVNWIPSMLADAGLTHKQAVMGAVTLNVGGILGSILVGRLSDRFGPFMPLMGGYGIGAVAIAFIGASEDNISLVMSVVFVAGFFVMGAQLALAALSARYYPTYMRSTGVGWGMGLGRIGSALGPIIGGALLAYGLSRTELFIAAAIPALIVVVAVFFMSRHIPQKNDESPKT